MHKDRAFQASSPKTFGSSLRDRPVFFSMLKGLIPPTAWVKSIGRCTAATAPHSRSAYVLALRFRVAQPFFAAAERSAALRPAATLRSEEHTSELQSLMRISYAVFCLKKTKNRLKTHT